MMVVMVGGRITRTSDLNQAVLFCSITRSRHVGIGVREAGYVFGAWGVNLRCEAKAKTDLRGGQSTDRYAPQKLPFSRERFADICNEKSE